MQLVILAGGKGTRLGLTDIPKPMCPVAGKPLLERQIELAKAYGIDEVFILSGHLPASSATTSATVRNSALKYITLLNRFRSAPPAV